MERENLTLEQLRERLHAEKNGAGKLPQYVRYCEGTDPAKNDAFFNKRLFIGDMALWIDIQVDSDKIREMLEQQGYGVTGEQRVPDGLSRNYDSTYYKLKE